MKCIERGLSHCLCLLLTLSMGLVRTCDTVFASDNNQIILTGKQAGGGDSEDSEESVEVQGSEESVEVQGSEKSDDDNEGFVEKFKEFLQSNGKKIVIGSTGAGITFAILGGTMYFLTANGSVVQLGESEYDGEEYYFEI